MQHFVLVQYPRTLSDDMLIPSSTPALLHLFLSAPLWSGPQNVGRRHSYFIFNACPSALVPVGAPVALHPFGLSGLLPKLFDLVAKIKNVDERAHALLHATELSAKKNPRKKSQSAVIQPSVSHSFSHSFSHPFSH